MYVKCSNLLPLENYMKLWITKIRDEFIASSTSAEMISHSFVQVTYSLPFALTSIISNTVGSGQGKAYVNSEPNIFLLLTRFSF